MSKVIVLTAIVLAYTFKAEAAKPVSICSTLKKAVAQGSASKKLDQFLSAQWKYWMVEYPEWATDVGYPGQDDRWNDRSLEAVARHKNENKCQLEILKSISPATLKGEGRVSYDLAKRNLEEYIEESQFPQEYMPIDHLGGLQSSLPDTVEAMPRATMKDYENILARLDKFPVVAEQVQALMKEGLRQRVTALKMFMSRVPEQFDKILPAKVEDSPIYFPFTKFGDGFTAEQKADLQKRGREVIQGKVYPAMQKLKQFIVTDYIPVARESIGYSQMPNGKAWYAFEVRRHTTTKMTPDELHDLGLREVARIRAEMDKVREEVKFKDDLKAFDKFLMKDKQFFYQSKEQLMLGYRDIAKRIDPELSKVFKTLPRLPYGVREMPEYKAAHSPAAYYWPGSPEAGRAGYFEANTSDLPGRPKWGMEVLTAHEAVPGHHLQIAIAQELKGLPEFRTKALSYTAFTEGWGLYSESLGPQLGLYQDPYSRYGQLAYEIWRASRLVVDTGIHSKGWSRQQAIDYFLANMPKSQQETENEIDRYITWPGQALAYKVGQLKFIELREKAKGALGDKFDIREYHDEVLRHGALPMDVLEKYVNQWIDSQKKKPAKKIKTKV